MSPELPRSLLISNCTFSHTGFPKNVLLLSSTPTSTKELLPLNSEQPATTKKEGKGKKKVKERKKRVNPRSYPPRLTSFIKRINQR